MLDAIQADVGQIAAKVDLLSKFVWPALAAIIPAAITAVVKWSQDQSRSRRRVALADRLIVLGKAVREFPKTDEAADLSSPRSVLLAEIDALAQELAAVQLRIETRQSTTAATLAGTSRFRAAFLLYRPHGLGAWALHLMFYASVVILLFALLGMAMNPSELREGLIGFAVLGIPPLIVRYYASRLHQRHVERTPAVDTDPAHAASDSIVAGSAS